MKWQQGEESDNLEDRRRMGSKGIAIGGIGTVLVLLIAYFLGVDPQKLNQFFNNPPPGGDQGPVEERPPTAEEERTRKFAATILRFTEVVWDEQFKKAGERYQPPHMVL